MLVAAEPHVLDVPVHCVHYPAQEADWMILGNSFSKIGRKKNNFVGGVSFKLYLCHSLSSIPEITNFWDITKPELVKVRALMC